MSDTKPGRGLAMFRLVLWVLVVIVGIGATILFVLRNPDPAVGTGFGGGPFELQATSGGTFSSEDLKGTPSLVFFGYTFCPDVCPTTLAETTAWRQSLNLNPDDLRIIFVSVDPDRDTLDVLSKYLAAFGSPILGLTGSETQVAQAKAAFGVFSEKTDVKSATDYLVNHTATVYLMDSAGNLFGTIAYGEDPDAAKAKMKRLADA